MSAWLTIALTAAVIGTVFAVSWWWAREQHNRQVELLKIRRAEMNASWKLHSQTLEAFSHMLRSSRAERINAERLRGGGRGGRL